MTTTEEQPREAMAAQIEALASVSVTSNGELLALVRNNLPAIVTALRQTEGYPQHIGDLHLGENRSDGERLCSHGHPVPEFHPFYWPQQISQYDDSDPCCLEHAIERYADHSSGYPEPLRQTEAAPGDEARNDAWNEFEDDYLTDGNDGWRDAKIIRACRAAFDGAWSKGRSEAFAAALACIPKPQAEAAPGAEEDDALLADANSWYSAGQIEEMEDRCRVLRTEIRRCGKVIESGKADPWWREDRDRFQQELNGITEILARQHGALTTASPPIEVERTVADSGLVIEGPLRFVDEGHPLGMVCYDRNGRTLSLHPAIMGAVRLALASRQHAGVETTQVRHRPNCEHPRSPVKLCDCPAAPATDEGEGG